MGWRSHLTRNECQGSFGRHSLSSLEGFRTVNRMPHTRWTAFRIHAEILLDERKWHGAVAEARRACPADMQFRSRSYLGRICVVAAEHTNDLHLRNALFAEARDSYAKTSLTPAAVWIQPSLYPPGTLAADMTDYLDVSTRIGPDPSSGKNQKGLMTKLHLHPLPLAQ